MSDDYPEVRTELEIVEAFHDLAEECETGSNSEDVPERFLTAWRLMLEARVPRMPDSADELRDMLQRTIDDPSPTLSLVELGKSLEANRALFMDFKTQFEMKLSCEAYESAAMMLMPVTDACGPGHYHMNGNGSYYPFSMGVGTGGENSSYPRCTIWRAAMVIPMPDTVDHVYSTAPLPGLAMLASICKAHAEWHEIWKR